MDALGLTNLFSFVIADARKPQKTSFLKAIKQLKLKPEEILFVGDNPQMDLQGAKSVGMKTCLARYGIRELEKYIKSDYKINQFRKLMNVLK